MSEVGRKRNIALHNSVSALERIADYRLVTWTPASNVFWDAPSQSTSVTIVSSEQMRETAMIYEVRDYHYRTDLFDAYKRWAEEAVPVLKSKLDIVGFWVDSGIEPEVSGTDPMNPPLGQANITWIIRWESKVQRDERLPEVIASEEWQGVWAKHPDPDGYRQMLGRFMEEM